jgi:predicted anti-sigma-YlaC factor YlaD
MAENDCHDLLGGLSEYVDGTADADLCAKIESHLADCENCRVVVDTLGRTVSLYRVLPEENVPGDVQERLLEVLHLHSYGHRP